MGIFSILKNVGKVFLSGITSFFQAVVTLSWGIAGFFLLVNFVQQYKFNPESISSLINFQQIIMQNSIWFFLAFAAFYFWQNFISLNEKEAHHGKK